KVAGAVHLPHAARAQLLGDLVVPEPPLTDEVEGRWLAHAPPVEFSRRNQHTTLRPRHRQGPLRLGPLRLGPLRLGPLRLGPLRLVHRGSPLPARPPRLRPPRPWPAALHLLTVTSSQTST